MIKFFLLSLLFASATTSAHELKIMTWNVFMLPKPVKISHQKTRTALIATQLQSSDRDVILFQEAFSGHFRKVLGKQLKDIYPYQLQLKKTPYLYPFMGPGLFILSKYPMKELGHDYYKKCTVADCYASKGVILAEVTLPNGKSVQIANTHLQSGGKDKSIEVRRTQLAQVRKLIDAHKKDGVPQLFIGDLNINSMAGEEFTGTLGILGMNTVPLINFPEEISEEAPAQKTSLEDIKNNIQDFFSAGFEIKCYRKPGGNNPKLIDHILYQTNGAVLKFSEDRINQFEGLINDEMCPLSDHYARQINIDIE